MAPSAVPSPFPASSRATSPPPNYNEILPERSVVGINFGNSYSSVAVINKEGLPDCIANEDGDRQIGTAISFANGQTYFGKDAKHQLIRNPDHTIVSFRNTLLKPSSQKLDTSLYTSAPFDVSSGIYTIPPPAPPSPSLEPSVPPTPLKTPAISRAASANPSRSQTPQPAAPSPSPIPEPPVPTPQNLASLYVKYLISNATAVLGSEPKTVVLTAKDDWTEEVKSVLKAVVEGAEKVEVVKETDAVLKAYEEFDKASKREVKKDRNVLIVDIGGRSMSLSLVQARDGLYIPKQYYSIPNLDDEKQDVKTLGGDHLTSILSTHFRKEFTKKTKIALPESRPEMGSADLRPWTKLVLACEETKKSLSVISSASGAAGAQSANCNIESLKEGNDYHGSINKGRWELITGSWWDGVVDKINSWLGEKQTLDDLILVGGTASLPSFALRMHSFFPDLKVRNEIDPSEVLAKGAALLARDIVSSSSPSASGATTPNPATEEVREVPTLSKPIGLVFGEEFVTLADEGTPLPARRRVAIPLPSKGGVEGDSEDGKVRIEIWEGEWVLEIKKPEPKVPNGDKKDEEDEEDLSEDEEEEERIKKVEKRTNLADILLPVKKFKTIVETLAPPTQAAAAASSSSKKKKKKGAAASGASTPATTNGTEEKPQATEVKKRLQAGNVVIELVVEKDGKGRVEVKQDGEDTKEARVF
ncbi:actin-like ATPase domain-containing protein [Atractiella rhizophila]|nr:actin-like ATPase domain-containing protein [Atractiella rhizophila]